MRLPAFFPRNEGRTVRTCIKKQNVEFCDDSFERDWSVVGGSVWRMVVMMWRGEYRR
jgi:hypothetical protein